MKATTLTLLLLALLSTAALSQSGTYNSGNSDLDSDLSSIDVEASANFGAFRLEMGTTYNLSERRIDELHTSLKMRPGEIYFALELSRITAKPIDEVIRVYKANRTKGWGAIAKELGTKPGSKEFHALKERVKKHAGKGNKPPKGKGNGNGKGKKK